MTEKGGGERRDDPTPTLADKLGQAIRTLHPADRGPYSNSEIASMAAQLEPGRDRTISANYVAMLRSGQRTNPTLNHLKQLADVFGVPVSYFVEDSPHAAAVHRDLELVAALQDADVREIAARSIELDPAMREWLRNTVAGLPPRHERATRARHARFRSPDDVGGSEELDRTSGRDRP